MDRRADLNYFERTALKLLVMIYNSVRPENSSALFTDGYGEVYDTRTEAKI